MELLAQVRLHHYADAAHFVIELATNEPGDHLVLAKLPAGRTLSETSAGALNLLRRDAPDSGANDLLIVPCMVCDVKKSFPELEGHVVASRPGEVVRRALQGIEFRMNEEGVRLHSEAMVTFGCAATVPIRPRELILGPPFLLLLQRSGAPVPYFAAWIGNADLLRDR